MMVEVHMQGLMHLDLRAAETPEGQQVMPSPLPAGLSQVPAGFSQVPAGLWQVSAGLRAMHNFLMHCCAGLVHCYYSRDWAVDLQQQEPLHRSLTRVHPAVPVCELWVEGRAVLGGCR